MTHFELRWILALFGTAVGAGILFLPIRAGASGIWPVVIMCFIIFPMVYISHRGMARFVATAGGDITQSAEVHFGKKSSLTIAILYFFAFYTICLAYCVGVTNTVESFGYNQILPLLDGGAAEFVKNIYYIDDSGAAKLVGGWRFGLVVVLVSLMMGVMAGNVNLVIKVCEALVWPLCLVLFGFSWYLMPHWNIQSFAYVPSWGDMLIAVWLTLPILVFAFEHAPAISTFAHSMRERFHNKAQRRSEHLLFKTAVMLLGFVMLFVFSCVLALSPEELAIAKAQNVSILTFFANKLNEPVISWSGPVIAIIAIMTSFFGHYFGAREGAIGIVRESTDRLGKNMNEKIASVATAMAMYFSMIIVGFYDPSVLGVIEQMGGPIITAMLFIMPVVAAYVSDKMHGFRSPGLDIFMLIAGGVTIATVIYTF